MNRFCKSFEQDSWAPLGLGGEPPASEVGFSWGYADLLDASASGVVVIWAHGLPFSPGILRLERAGEPVHPRSAPAVSIAVYENGIPVFWHLRDLDPDEVDERGFGGLSVARTPGRLELGFDVPVPGGEPLRGELTIEGTDFTVPPAGDAVHRWAPQLIGRGRADLRCGAWRSTIAGRAYHDRNASALGLSHLGIRRWIWGRTPHPGGETVHYLLEPLDDRPEQNHVLEFDWNGGVDHRFVEVERGPEARGRWGLTAPRWLDAGGLRVEHRVAWEDGPFYQRWQTAVRRPDGTEHLGVGEVVDVERIDRGWLSPLVGMAKDGPRASIWSPLFCGPGNDRVSRLLRYWWQRLAG